ncbi:MAG TPA: glycosyltransferase family 4 protein [Anaerolineales bacterium]|nr:glycosyltransferase family 4 protein [Anaerolineales bacterium]
MGLRILHLHHRYWPGLGGGEAYLQEFSARLAADGHSVTVATSDALEPTAHWDPRAARLTVREAEHRGVRILRFPLHHLPGSPFSYSLWRYHLFFNLSRWIPVDASLRLSRYTPWVPDLWRWAATTAERFDLIAGMAVLYEPFVAAGQMLARRLGAPHVVYPLTHLGAEAKPGADKVSRYYTMRHQLALVARADHVITITESERSYYIARGIPAERLSVASPGVEPADAATGDAAAFRARHGLAGPIVAFLATMLPDKGAIQVVQAIAHLAERGKPVTLVMAGNRVPVFETFFARQPDSVRANVRVLGVITEEEKRDLLAAADVLAMPSRTDSFGIVYLEAWLAGKPVIGARAWAMDEVIADGVDGLLVPFGDAEALADALAGLLDDPARRAALGAAGRAKVLARYTWAHAYARVRAAYQGLVAGVN